MILHSRVFLYNPDNPLQRLSIAIQRGNAAAVLGTVGRSGERDPFWE